MEGGDPLPSAGRTHALQRTAPPCRDVTPRMLTNQLRELEADGLIEREVFAQVPPRVEYSLSDRGRSLSPIIAALKDWGDANMDLFARR
ncbi:winged helix-turn-helix transcriptional regulator [Sphingomonas sp. I4]